MMGFLTVLASVVFLYGTVDAITCPDGWTTHGNSCYFFGHDSLHFYEAQHFCEHLNGHLVHINGDQENRFIKNYLSQLKDPIHWIGLTDDLVEKNWMWTDNHNHVNYTDWAPGQPDHGTHQNCVAMNKAVHYHWGDFSCTNSYKPICEMIPLSATQDPGVIVG